MAHRIAVLGCGGMGTFHAHALAAVPGAHVALLADPFGGDRVAALGAELGAVVTEDVAAAAVSDDIDAVVIASPDETHAELTLAAMAAGKRVLCEKPLATTVDDACAVVEAEQALGRRVVQVGFMREYDVPHRQVAEAIADDGPLHLIRAVHRNTNADSRPDLAVVGQSIVHDLHSLRFLSGGEITAITGYATRRDDGGLRHVVLVAELTSGGHGVVEFDDDGFAYEVSVDVTIGSSTVTSAGPVRAVERRDAAITTTIGRDWFGWFADAYRIQDAAWVRSLDDPAASGPSTWDGLAAQIAVEAALGSLTGGGRVAVELPERPPVFD